MLDLTPGPHAAPARQRILAHARTEAMLLLRNGEQLLLALVIPLGLLIGGHALRERFDLDATTFPASVLALAIFSSTFTSLAIATAFERRYGVLERLAPTPLGRSGLLVGKALATTSVAGLQVVVIAAVALALGWRPALAPLPWLCAVVTAVMAALAFANAGLVLAGALRAEAVLAVANLLYVVLAAGGALVIPVADHPGFAHPILRCLPTAALGEALRGAAAGTLVVWPVLIATVWAAALALLARKVFRWLQ